MSGLPCEGEQALEVRLQDIELAVQDHALSGAVTMAFFDDHVHRDSGAIAVRAEDMKLACCF